jgi:hypothetical protein
LEAAHANSSRDPISKNPSQKRAGRVAQGVGPEFKPQYCKKKKTITFSPKESTSQFSLSCLNCQHHHSYVVEPLLSKVKGHLNTNSVAVDSQSHNRDSYKVTEGWVTYTVWLHWTAGGVHRAGNQLVPVELTAMCGRLCEFQFLLQKYCTWTKSTHGTTNPI